MLPFAMVDTLTSTLDLRTLARTLRLYGKAVVRELLQGKV
jgi:C-8 sterol isomerase